MSAEKLANALTGNLVGAVVIFRPGTSTSEAHSALINVPSVDPENITVEAFNPDLGYPVFYIP